MRQRLPVLFAMLLVVLAPFAASPAGAAANAAYSQPADGAPPPGRPQAPAANIQAQPGQAYIHLSNVNNTAIDYTHLENIALNGNPNIKFLAINQFSPEGFLADTNNHPLGVYYDTGPNRWQIFNDDQAAMDYPHAWNVFIPAQDSNLILHVTSSGNITGSQTFINSPQFYLDPDANIFVQHVYGPFVAGSAPATILSTAYYTRNAVVRYDNSLQTWSIMNADGSPFQQNRGFFVWRASNDKTTFRHITTVDNTSGYSTLIDNPATNGNPNALLLVTQNYGTGVTNQVNDHRVGLSYSLIDGKWVIYNLDGISTMVPGLMFNVLVVPPKQGSFLHTVTETSSSSSVLNNPDLDNNPYALVYVTHNWNPPESPNGLYHDHPVGVDYAAGHWRIVNQDNELFQTGTTFNVFYTWPRADSFAASATATNTSFNVMTLNNPLLDTNPSAVAVATLNKTPNNFAGSVYSHSVGLKYASSAWKIFGGSGPIFQNLQTYNVFVPPVASSFAATASGVGSGQNWFDIDNALTNADPWAMVFVTPVDNSGINQNNIGVYYDSSTNKWAVFNEDGSIDMANGTAYNVFVVKRLVVYLPFVKR